MVKGCLFALSACLIWGLIFVIPKYIEGFGAIEIMLGRFSFFGLISLILYLTTSKTLSFSKYKPKVWLQALLFALTTNILYYAGVVFCGKHACPAVCALILGISPIAIAFYGNWKEKECEFKSLILPACLIFLGLLIINLPSLQNSEEHDLADYLLGLAAAGFALCSWSWYVVANSHFLKKNPEVSLKEWPTLIGLGTLVWVVFISVIGGLFFTTDEDFERYFTFDDQLQSFLIGCAILGILCSWVGSFLWNYASIYLPVSLAGQLTIFETVFGLVFVYMMEQRLPDWTEGAGMCLILLAVFYGLQVFRKPLEAH
jgi:drug/metabolite transporter (DMT)-like permease